MANVTKIAVVGAGIIGMSCAVDAIESVDGIEVTVIAEKFTPDTTGDGSAGLCYPYLLGSTSDDTIRCWGSKTLKFLRDLYMTPEISGGIGLISAFKISEKPIENEVSSDVFFNWRSMSDKELDLFPIQYRYGVFYTSMFAECTKLLPYLMTRFTEKNGKIVKKRIEDLSELAEEYDVVINCTGVQSAYLASDSDVFPIRGQVIRVKAPWIKHVISADDYYIIPNSEEVICGGTHQEGDWNRAADPEDRKIIWDGCTELVPSLKDATVLRDWVGLRPGRSSPRLERESKVTKNKTLEIVHNYGHGGSGVTLFWGCAKTTTELLKQALLEVQARKLKLDS